MKSDKHIHIILDMDSTLLSIECLDTVIETALGAELEPGAITDAMKLVNEEMDKGMAGQATIKETIPARIAIAKRLGAPVRPEHFKIVAGMVPSALSENVVQALQRECSVAGKYSIVISVVSGGPQECVDAAVKELQKRVHTLDGSSVTFKGIGNKIRVTREGDFDQLESDIQSSKIETIHGLVEEPELSIMIGDAAVDVEVYDVGVVNYFIAFGLWVQRPVLFARPDNPPHYLKVTTNDEFTTALRDTLHESQR